LHGALTMIACIQVATLLGILAVRCHDRTAYTEALQPVLAACSARLDSFAVSNAPAFSGALESLVGVARGLQAGNEATEWTASDFFKQQAADRSCIGQGASAALHILLAVSACAGSCSEGHAAAVGELLTSARLRGSFVATSRHALSAKFAAVCAADKQCRCQQAALASLLYQSLAEPLLTCNGNHGMLVNRPYHLDGGTAACPAGITASVALLATFSDRNQRCGTQAVGFPLSVCYNEAGRQCQGNG
jgi:hypothetical protein